jgi:site-specific DNA-methyltransferase (adenine-specific)
MGKRTRREEPSSPFIQNTGKRPARKAGTSTSSFGSTARIAHDSSKFYNTKLYEGLVPGKIVEKTENEFPKHLLNTVILGSSENMKEIPDRSLHLMITSPPYNVTKEYDGNLSLKEYLGLLEKVFGETYRVLVHGGRACVNLANIGRKPYLPLSDFVSKIMLDIGFTMRGEIIWNKGSSAGVSMAWGSYLSAANPVLRDVHEYILVFSKGDFSRTQNGKKSTITKAQWMEWTKSVWNFSTESAKRVGHPAPFPEELPYRLIQLYSFKGDIVLDPFMGSGTTALSALKTGRSYVGYEIVPAYHKKAEDRLNAFKNQKSVISPAEEVAPNEE